MMVITVADVLVRYLTPRNVPGSYEYVSLLFVLVIYLGLAYAQRENSHIAIDALYSRLPRPYRKLLQLFQLGTFLLFSATLTWYTAGHNLGQLRPGGYDLGSNFGRNVALAIDDFYRFSGAGVAFPDSAVEFDNSG